MHQQMLCSLRRFLGTLLLTLLAGSAGAELAIVDFGPGNRAAHLNSIGGSGDIRIKTVAGEPTGAVLRISNGGEGFAVQPSPDTVPAHSVDLSAIDGNQYQFNGTFRAVLVNLDPGQPYNVYLFGLRSGATMSQQVTMRGADTVRFEQAAGDGQLAVNDAVGSSSEPLSRYAKMVTASNRGTIDVMVVGTGEQGRPFVVAGLGFEPAGGGAMVTGSAAAASSALSASAVQAQQVAAYEHPVDRNRNILGIYLDMPVTEAAELVQNYHPNPNVQIGVNEGDTGGFLDSRLRGHKFPFSSSFDYRHPSTGWKKISVYASGPPYEGRVSAVGRLETLPDEILWTQMEASLVEKYGQPTYSSGLVLTPRTASYTMSWSYTADGMPITSKAMVDACAGIGVSLQNDAASIAGEIAVLTNIKYTGQRRQCGRVLTYVMQSMTQRTDYVNGYTALLYDLPMILRRNGEMVAFTVREAEKLAAQEKAAAQSRKPTL